ncbi:MutS-related protein [Mesoterricola sediminis]|uniref:DNA mismatch repair proteins mutS family domain-containing protein n=1 Tax=Mesoterricola sediminis TaxID=2927980 RepID=A0AA48H4X2_9BACT|nr:hypothetical protein [Mesoterricola sediminis]BDU76018.1 hypothetical protein METESE_09760 [Mesoterricola sediminis]
MPPTPPEPRDLDLVRLYHQALGDAPGTVDGDTWADLALDEVFRRFDRTASWMGSQMLYRRLRVLAADDADLEARTRAYAALRADPAWAARARRVLAPLGGPGTPFLAPFLIHGLPDQLPSPGLYIACALAPLACILGGLVAPWLLIASLAFLFVNIVLNETVGRRLSVHGPAFSRLHALLAAADALATLPGGPPLPARARLLALRPALARVQARLSTLAVDRSQLPELAAVVFGYLNILFLLDVVAFLWAVPALLRHRGDLLAALEALGELDADLAIAAVLDAAPGAFITPAFGTGRDLDVRDLTHPLLADPVGNDLAVRGRSVLITGSNMAGKTTFIKTVGVNLVLAQTLHLVRAAQATLPRLPVASSIRREDRLEAGQSYYLVEIQRLKAFADTPRPHLLLIDEILRGTNTVERVAASTALLRHLGATHLVLVTTHDLEVGQALADGFDVHHFAEQVTGDAFGFDYRLRPGPVYTRNAIRLLELSGFPAPVTEEARRLAGSVSAPA